MDVTRSTGRVRFFDVRRGFGFICPDAGGPDVFVSVQQLKPNTRLNKDEKVEFDLITGKRGPKAKHVVSLG